MWISASGPLLNGSWVIDGEWDLIVMYIFRCLAPAAVVAAVVTAAVTGWGGSAVVADAAGLSGSGAGTNIGNAVVLITVCGLLPGGLPAGCFVVYPAQARSSISRSPTPLLLVRLARVLHSRFDNTDGSGGAIATGSGAGGSYEQPQSARGSDRYYVEVSPFTRSSTGSQPATYSVAVVSGGGGTAPNPATGTVRVGKPVRWARRCGATRFTGSRWGWF